MIRTGRPLSCCHAPKLRDYFLPKRLENNVQAKRSAIKLIAQAMENFSSCIFHHAILVIIVIILIIFMLFYCL